MQMTVNLIKRSNKFKFLIWIIFIDLLTNFCLRRKGDDDSTNKDLDEVAGDKKGSENKQEISTDENSDSAEPDSKNQKNKIKKTKK